MDTSHKQLSSLFLVLDLGPQRCAQHVGREPGKELKSCSWPLAVFRTGAMGFIAYLSMQVSIAVFSHAAVADQHPSSASFPGPWDIIHCHYQQGCRQHHACATCVGKGATNSWC